MTARRKVIVGIVMAAVVGGLTLPAHAQRRRANNNDNDVPPTDAEVLESMRKGVHYLLDVLQKQDKPIHFESKFNWDYTSKAGPAGGGWAGYNLGGETALALYTLLHVGASVQSDDELGPRLKFSSKELAPVVKWLSQVKPDATYTGGLLASALTMVPKESDAGKAALPALKSDSYYLACAMDLNGGYGYSGPVAGIPDKHSRGVLEVWSWYVDAMRKNDQEKLKRIIPALEALHKQAGARFLGFEGMTQYVAADLKQREAEAKAKGPAGAAEVLKIQAEQKEYQRLALEWKKFQGDKNDPQCDLSNSQYGTLGAWALSDAEIEMPLGYWKLHDKFWRTTQKPDGMWPYNPKAPETRESMTVAGIASLYITSAMLDTEIRLTAKPDPEIERGLMWLNKNFEPSRHWYYMYGVERVGLASGLKFFGEHNWYEEGAKVIVKEQRPDGGWEGGEGNRTVATSYALLFLARGRNPVVFNKLQYADTQWNARPRDNANITAWISKNTEQPINWQVVNINVSPDEWTDAPILYISGSKPLAFKDDEIKKLRAFINAGGMIFTNADNGMAAFTESVKRIASQIVDEGGKPKYEMRELDKAHPLFSQKNELWKPIGEKGAIPKIFAMSNGVREIWVHSTVDMGASWQGRKVSNVDHFVFATNLYRYATGKQSPRSKLQPLNIEVAGAPASVRTINLARVDYAGNWDPEPGAWERMAKIMKRDARTELKITPVKFANLDPKATPVAHITGTAGFPANPADVAALKKFIEGGGTLICDSAGGQGDFKNAFEKFVAAAGMGDMIDVPLESKVYNGTLADSVDTTAAEYRAFYRLKVGNKTVPQLKGVEHNGRLAIIYSGEDLTSGLLGTNTYGILGYTQNSATNLVRNLLLYGNEPKGGNNGAGGAAAAAPAGK